MAGLFSGGAGQSYKAFSRITGYPFTMFCRAYADDITNFHFPFTLSLIPASGDRSMNLALRGDETGDLAKFRKVNAASSDIPQSAGAYAAFTWQNLGGSATDATSARLYRNGVRSNGAGTSVAFPTPSGPVVALGHLILNGSRLGMNGGASDFALWNAELTDAEQNSLAKGFSPRRVRPQSLVFFAPLVRNIHDLVNAGSWTHPSIAPGATPHPRVYGFP